MKASKEEEEERSPEEILADEIYSRMERIGMYGSSTRSILRSFGVSPAGGDRRSAGDRVI